MSLAAATVSMTIEALIEEAFGQIVPIDLSSIFTGYGPLPAVMQTRDQSGAWDAAGRTRTVAFADGSSARESLTTYDVANGGSTGARPKGHGDSLAIPVCEQIQGPEPSGRPLHPAALAGLHA